VSSRIQTHAERDAIKAALTLADGPKPCRELAGVCKRTSQEARNLLEAMVKTGQLEKRYDKRIALWVFGVPGKMDLLPVTESDLGAAQKRSPTYTPYERKRPRRVPVEEPTKPTNAAPAPEWMHKPLRPPGRKSA